MALAATLRQKLQIKLGMSPSHSILKPGQAVCGKDDPRTPGARRDRICSDSCTCCHTETEVADPTFCLTQSQNTDTGPASPSADGGRIKSRWSRTRVLKTGTVVAALPDLWRLRISVGTGRPGASILAVNETASLTCNFCLSVAARKVTISRSITEMHIVCCLDLKQTRKQCEELA